MSEVEEEVLDELGMEDMLGELGVFGTVSPVVTPTQSSDDILDMFDRSGHTASNFQIVQSFFSKASLILCQAH